MITDKPSINPESPLSGDSFLADLNFKSLPGYAKYLLENKLAACALNQANQLRDLSLSFLRPLANMDNGQLLSMFTAKTKQLLEHCASNNAPGFIKQAAKKWFTDQPDLFDESKITADDITNFGYMQRRSLYSFIPEYTGDVQLFSALASEIDLLTTRIAATLLKAHIPFKKNKQKKARIKENNRFAEKITNISPCIITVYNIETGAYKFVNNAVQSILGYLPAIFMEKGRNFFYELMHPADRVHTQQTISAFIERSNQPLAKTDEINQFKYRLQHKKGQYRWIHTFSTVFSRSAEGMAEDMLNVSVDITESQQLTLELATLNEEVKLKELQHQRMISEVEDYAILLMDKDGFIQNWNKGAEKIKGYAASEIIGKNFRLFYRKEDQEKKLPEALIKQATETGKASHEGWRVRKDKTTFWGNIVITAVHDENGNLIGFTKVTRDLTEKKMADDTLKEYAARIEKHNEELIRMNKDLDAFTYMASHDLQEPLRKIKTFCNLITEKTRDALPEIALNYFNRIIASTTRMQTLIDSLLTYSRTTTSAIVLTPTHLNAVIEDVKKELADVIKEKNILITHTDLPVLKIQPLQMHQLFFNLIENAIKYSRTNVTPQITITASKYWETSEGEKLLFYRIDVTDNGIGFEQKYSSNIFKLFQRLHGRNEYAGTGIGLAICKKIAENHKGTISATGRPGKGATFTLTLPAD